MQIGPYKPAGLTQAIVQQYIDLSLQVLGSKCDCCGCGASGTTKLLKCQQCQRKYYCSKECQSKDWGQSQVKHKRSCRLPKDFKREDLIRAQGLKSRPELNGQLLVVIGPAGTEGRWEVTVVGGEKSISLSADNMALVVPAEERVDL